MTEKTFTLTLTEWIVQLDIEVDKNQVSNDKIDSEILQNATDCVTKTQNNINKAIDLQSLLISSVTRPSLVRRSPQSFNFKVFQSTDFAFVVALGLWVSKKKNELLFKIIFRRVAFICVRGEH